MMWRCPCGVTLQLPDGDPVQLPIRCQCGFVDSTGHLLEVAHGGLVTRLIQLRTAHQRWIAAGRPLRSDAEVARIFEEHCSGCPMLADGTCSACGCHVSRDGRILNKIRWATESCPPPLRRW